MGKNFTHSLSRSNARWAGIWYIGATVAPVSTVFFVSYLGGQIAGGEPDRKSVV